MKDISAFLRENIVTQDISFEEYEDLYPMIDEIASMVSMLGSDEGQLQGMDIQDARTLISFGMINEIDDQGFWSVTQKVSEQCLE